MLLPWEPEKLKENIHVVTVTVNLWPVTVTVNMWPLTVTVNLWPLNVTVNMWPVTETVILCPTARENWPSVVGGKVAWKMSHQDKVWPKTGLVSTNLKLAGYPRYSSQKESCCSQVTGLEQEQPGTGCNRSW